MIKNCVVVAMSLAALSANQNRLQDTIAIRDLTVPADRLPAGCALVVPEPGRGTSWPIPIATNPWTGTDRRTVASIRQRIENQPPGVPDGSPLDARAASRYLLTLAEGIEEAYAAFYRQADSALITVYGLKFEPTSTDRYGSPSTTKMTRITIGSIDAFMDGNASDCSQAIEPYLQSLNK